MIPGFVEHRQACGMLGGISRQRLHQLQAEGRIACVWIGGRRIYRIEHVQRLAVELNAKRPPQFTLGELVGAEVE